MKIAIIGAGISGMAAAYLLSPYHEITLYEKNSYFGGHSRTIDFETNGNCTSVDTGFIVFNNWNYPNLLGLFKELDVPYQKSDMSFGVSIYNGWLEYGSNGMFSQKRNWLRPSYYKMLLDIIKFNKQAEQYLDKDIDVTLEQCLSDLKMGRWFREYYLLAMGAAIWSCPIEKILKFPAKTYVQFFKNHGLLNIVNRPQWYTVTGGSREYVSRLMERIKGDISIKKGAIKVFRSKENVIIEDINGNKDIYDEVIFACHANETLDLVNSITHEEFKILNSFKYQDNSIVVHSDANFMPKINKCWASWVYLSEETKDDKDVVSLTYWMNNLQKIECEHDVFVTLNPGRKPDKNKIIDEHKFSHPIFDAKAIIAQKQINEIQGKNRSWYCGAYQRYGFHEDGLLSAVNIAKKMGVEIPWEN